MAQPTIVYAKVWTFELPGDDQTTEWIATIALFDDLSCRVLAKPSNTAAPFRSKVVDINFWSMAELQDNIESALSKQHLPRVVADTLRAAVPDFLIDAEVEYLSGQYLEGAEEYTG